ncbi:hypothetical protein O6H91_15G042900 [Diphasiastrum complanatum]|uniref:Uncharacterized protein n=1 Tax=Diphasiastrum complanatum TaxID=34168 RepID=A0ACC2BHU0_DIPCM|nr:hypothetical protein O6H91_15G042900 [Diphasiastrum complanatum]
MASNLARWQMDPFFSAAEEVQNSADRMESAYRTWKHMKTLVGANPRDSAALSAVNARRSELLTTLDTVKWQLEEFERAVELATLTEQVYLEGKAPSRHRQFVRAIQSQLLSVMSELGDMISNHVSKSVGKNIQGEDADDLTNFLLGSRFSTRTLKDDVRIHPLELQQPYQDGQLLNKNVMEHWAISGPLSNGLKNENTCIKDMLDQTLCSPESKTTDTKEAVFEEDYASSEFGTSTSEAKSEDKERQFFPHYASSEFSTSTSEGHPSDWPAHSIDMEIHDSQDTRKVGILGLSLGFGRLWKNKREPGKLQVSRSGFKRWKDGDASFGDYCEDGAVRGFSPVLKAGCMPPNSEKVFYSRGVLLSHERV